MAETRPDLPLLAKPASTNDPVFGVLKARSGDYAMALAASAVLLVLTALIGLAVGRGMAARPIMVKLKN